MTSPKLDKLLTDKGLNLQAIFNLFELPREIIEPIEKQLDDISRFRQLILLGHGGKAFWSALKNSPINTDNPVDDFSIDIVRQLFATKLSNHCFQIIYPGPPTVPLQTLGELAGWHNRSPFMVGINAQWGSWFAYRVAILADTQLDCTPTIAAKSPCLTCSDKPCISSCPATAITAEHFDIRRCTDYRSLQSSPCIDKCISRISCPVKEEHRYSEEQINYHYGQSMKMINNFKKTAIKKQALSPRL